MSNIQSYINLLKANKNLVLTGAPGTGKTFLAKEIAKAMDAEVEFVQFHPSYDYTDFVEGLRPVDTEEGQIGFERKDGIFKDFCKEAMENMSINKKKKVGKKTLFDYYEELSGKIRKGYITKITTRNGKEIYVSISKKGTINGRTKSSKYEVSPYSMSFNLISKLAECYPDTDSLKKAGLHSGRDSARVAILSKIYEMRDAETHTELKEKLHQKDLVLEQEQNDEDFLIYTKPYVFIIDEINRGELSKIFGELFYAIDPGYRGEKGKVKTQYQNLIDDEDVFTDGFFVPENVYILATMNDIDRSVESIDFAMRRRFAWKEIKPEDSLDMLSEKLYHDTCEKAVRVMNALNKEISNTRGLGSAYQIGPAYFLKLDKEHYNGDFTALWDMHIEILLYEYFRGYSNADAKVEDFKNVYFDSLNGTSVDVAD